MNAAILQDKGDGHIVGECPILNTVSQSVTHDGIDGFEMTLEQVLNINRKGTACSFEKFARTTKSVETPTLRHILFSNKYIFCQIQSVKARRRSLLLMRTAPGKDQ